MTLSESRQKNERGAQANKLIGVSCTKGPMPSFTVAKFVTDSMRT